MFIFGYSIKFCFTSYPICPKTLDHLQSVFSIHYCCSCCCTIFLVFKIPRSSYEILVISIQMFVGDHYWIWNWITRQVKLHYFSKEVLLVETICRGFWGDRINLRNNNNIWDSDWSELKTSSLLRIVINWFQIIPIR